MRSGKVLVDEGEYISPMYQRKQSSATRQCLCRLGVDQVYWIKGGLPFSR